MVDNIIYVRSVFKHTHLTMKTLTVVYNPHQLISKPLVCVSETEYTDSRGFKKVKTGRIGFWPEHQVATMVVSVKKYDIFLLSACLTLSMLFYLLDFLP